MSDVMESQIRHLQERLKGAEMMLANADRVIEDLREKGRENIRLGRENADLRAALRPFGREYTHAYIAPRSAFARAAELVAEEGGE